MEDRDHLTEITADVVSSYVSNNTVEIDQLEDLIANVHRAFSRLVGEEQNQPTVNQVPAVAVKNSVSDNYLTCLEDGLEFKSLKRHLRSHHNLSPEQYRDKWNLPAEYPMVAPSYSLKRSKLAREIGLGRPPKD